MKFKIRLVAIDFDGVIVDSYYCLPEVYKYIGKKLGLKGEVLKRFVREAIRREDIEDARVNYDHAAWWPQLMEEFGIRIGEDQLMRLNLEFWELRSKMSKIIEGAEEFLRGVKERGIKIVVLAGNDGVRGLKRKRVERSKLSRYFDDIIIVGDDVENRVEAINFIAKKYGVKYEEIMLIDDKPRPINEVNEAKMGVITVKVSYQGILKKAWEGPCSPTITVDRVLDIVHKILADT